MPTSPSEPLTSFGDGEFRVGVDVAPGRYRAVAPSEDCAWGTGASPEELGPTGAPTKGEEGAMMMLPLTVADVRSGERFVSEGCGEWSDDLAPVVEPEQPFDDGTYIVGLDIAPGRYRAAAPSNSCFWLRLGDFRLFGGKYGSHDIRTTIGGWGTTVIGGDASSIVDIESTDIGFYSAGCGTWTNYLTPIATPGQPFPDGTYIVGDEVVPGRYRAREPSAECYWARLGDFSGKHGEGGDYFITRRSGPTSVVDIAPGDGGFYSRGCGTWSDDLSPITTPGEPFPDGTYLVGVDIAPGRYRTATAPEHCLWLRLYDFAGVYGAYEGLHAIAIGRLAIVDIALTDVGFTSRGCGTWSPDPAPIVTPGEPFGDGTYLVGTDVAPGRYSASDPGASCYWTRLGSFSGDTSFGYDTPADIIAYGSLAIVEIFETDAGFGTSGCGTWSEVSLRASEPKRSFEDGTYIVGRDIAPGRYFANTPPGQCEWERLDGFGGYDRRGDIGIGGGRGYGLPSRLAVVDIRPSDAGFHSSGCGEWTQTFEPRVSPGEPPGDGFFLVGVELVPGRYRATTPETCRFERRSSFSGRYFDGRRYIDEGLAGRTNDSAIPHGGLGVVDIEPTDAGFVSRHCGWTADLTPRLVPGLPFSDGTYLVGPEIAPGRYRAPGVSGGCWWKRLSRFGGHFHSGVIVSTIGRGWTTLVDIKPSDAGFHSWGCGTWTPELSPVLAPGEAISNGTFLVGVDLAPGRYRALTPGDIRWCYWARLSGFGGTGDEVLGHLYGYPGYLGGASLIVEIKPSDVGFYTDDDCGEWTPDTGQPVEWPNSQLRDGVYYVGTEVAPGRYRSASPSPNHWTGCSWWRLSGFGGSEGEFLGSFHATWDTDSSIVDITATDAGFASSGCGEWTTDLTPVISPGDPFADGSWLVGEEISPGRYVNAPGYTDSEGRPRAFECEWQRVSGFLGSEAETIEAGSARAGAVITVAIAATDVGFVSRGCGTWTPATP